MDRASIRRLELSFDMLRPRAHEMASRVFDRLTTELPHMRDAFPTDPNDRRQRLLAAMTLAMTNVNTPECIVNPFEALAANGDDHWSLRDHDTVITKAVVDAMSAVAGKLWTRQLTNDWSSAFAYAGHASEVFLG
jgi:hemoglobin-like flavoprotein